MFNLRRNGDLSFLHTDIFPLSVSHAFMTRRLGASKTAPADGGPNFRIDSLPETVKWWKQLRDSLYTHDHVCFANHQVHSGKVKIVDPDNLEGEEKDIDGFKIRILGDADAIVKPFTRKQIYLAITTADCIPCLVYDVSSHAVGVVHAGWRGLSADIPAAALTALKKTLGSKISDLRWAIGPSIDFDNYQVGPDVIASLETAGFAESDWDAHGAVPGWVRERKGDRYRLNLAACLKIRLMNLGIKPDQTDYCVLSTYGNPNLFYSYRRDGVIMGLHASVIG
jgi:polyphenol oxidase